VASSRGEREELVDTFAGEFLLPEKDLRTAISKIRKDELRASLIALAAEYRVSWSAVVSRARQYSTEVAEEFQQLRADSPLRGDFLAIVGREPSPDLKPGDRGPQWRRSVLRARAEGLITAARVIELLGDGLEIDEIPDRNKQ
jgi:Zn-dependent peptidase ImmA (M78 family)